jgi:hypothetical protein
MNFDRQAFMRGFWRGALQGTIVGAIAVALFYILRFGGTEE